MRARAFARRLWKRLNERSFALEYTAASSTLARVQKTREDGRYRHIVQAVRFQNFPTLLWSEFRREPIVPAVSRKPAVKTLSQKRIAKRAARQGRKSRR